MPNGLVDAAVPLEGFAGGILRRRLRFALDVVGSELRLPDTSVRSLVAHGMGFSRSAAHRLMSWRLSGADAERLVLLYRCRRNSSLMLAFRRASWFAAYQVPAGCSLDVLLATDALRCVHGCGPRFDTSAHAAECVGSVALRGLRQRLSATLVAVGVLPEMARRLGHHPSCLDDFLRGRVPTLWGEHGGSQSFVAE
eukprot:gene4114-5327_t